MCLVTECGAEINTKLLVACFPKKALFRPPISAAAAAEGAKSSGVKKIIIMRCFVSYIHGNN
jgi:hypothetical protein